ncbi:MAG: alpha-L-fucosidase, partial [Planctomycetes bacterium]|nr:alpha-L-fucosidase [Planctomycetota bacterium]
MCVPSLHAEDMKPAKKYDYNWASLKSHPVPQWFDDAKFGIFIHWGPYSVMGYRKNGRGYAEHTPKEIYRNPEHYYEYLKETFGAHPPQFGYKDVIPILFGPGFAIRLAGLHDVQYFPKFS